MQTLILRMSIILCIWPTSACFLKNVHSSESFGTLLDHGCGGSPYRPLFMRG